MSARTQCQGNEVHSVDFGVGPVDVFDVACGEVATHAVTFETWDPEADRPFQETALVCRGHLDEEDVPGAMRHIRTTLLDDMPDDINPHGDGCPFADTQEA